MSTDTTLPDPPTDLHAWYAGLAMHALLTANSMWDAAKLAKIAHDYARAMVAEGMLYSKRSKEDA